MKKNILILLVVIFFIIAGVIIFFISKRISPQPITKIANINQPIGVKGQEKNIANGNLFFDELINKEKISPELISPVLDYYSFCEYKNNNITFNEQCVKTNEKYFGTKNGTADCIIRDGKLAAIDFIKKGEKDKFLKICQEYIPAFKSYIETDRHQTALDVQRFDKFYNDCNLLWENKMYGEKEFCDFISKEGGTCHPILLDEDQNCSNKINIETVNLDSLKSSTCNAEIPLRRASQKSDCLSIKNPISHLFCLDAFDDNVCTELKEGLENFKLPDFIAKYQLQALH